MSPQLSGCGWETITFRLVGRADFPLIADWLAEPHAARWWNQEFTIDAVERDFGPRVDGTEPGEDYLVLVDGRPVGLIQHSRFGDYPEYVEELAPVVTVPADAVTIDYLIGDPALTGHGLGTAMLARFVDHLWQTTPEAALRSRPGQLGQRGIMEGPPGSRFPTRRPRRDATGQSHR